MKLLAPLTVILLLGACAGTPPQPAATTTTFAPAAAPAAAADPVAAARQKVISDARTAGYSPVTRDGVTKYCRSDTGTGSHIPDYNCYTEDQLAEQLRVEAANREEWARTHGNCGNSSCVTK